MPVGAGNSIQPDGPDRGQPTYFYTRFNRLLFSVKVPADFGKRELVWTLTVRGRTERAIGWLKAEWEIDESAGATGMPTRRPEKERGPDDLGHFAVEGDAAWAAAADGARHGRRLAARAERVSAERRRIRRRSVFRKGAPQPPP